MRCKGTCIDTIFPEEFTSFLSLILSTIPMFKKGTDSRFGFGFRNNQNSDVQFLFELGPQTYTQSLDSDNSIDKREVKSKDSIYNSGFKDMTHRKKSTPIDSDHPGSQQ
ncbi:uncharacterized protein LOC129619318 [Condylostylus longicornis]|uniref:uncharacterized protein LOC129619318 n=1 Tax=Condylostylus longicornis TaxID=2530218 RepID=UPI00244DF9AA|nr:uncharacterized protein LOC129619318 [Condylostylus longicornis]